ncbi:hypothetical protein V1264_018972 [Littorina saxatilis]|uniref:Fibronectin type-III domain-containing protein n=1 Tax=Littorina saxatilis TaxID=31220 RepID=A0AAN9BDQ5_9CAEN
MQNRGIDFFLLLVFAYCPVPAVLVEKGFVYCPAYPCVCESDNGALVVNCQYLYLTQLPKFLAFDGRIKTLSLRKNSIRQLPAAAFQGLHVESLDLTENVISHVHDQAFEGLEDSLEELHLQVYAMDGVPSAAIKSLKKLKVLRIIGCKADTLNSSAFEGLNNLVELHLQGCRIKDIDAGGLASLKKLQVLNLAGNSLQTEHLAEVAKLYELRNLVLSRNRVTKLPNHAFDHLLHLKHLDLSHNRMTEVDADAFKPLHYSLEVLKLHDNLLTKDVFQALNNLRNLRHLVLSANNITSIPGGAFHKHEFLGQLELSDNGISAVTKQTLKGTEKYLQTLKLDNNPLVIFRNNTFNDHTRLQTLALDSTSLGGSLTEGIFHGVNITLRKLTLSGANLTTMDLFAVSGLVRLEELDVSENFISNVPELIFQKLNNLQKLDLSQNVIEKLPDGAFRGLEASLETVDLHDNYLQTLSYCLFEDFQRLGAIKLGDNPLACDCRLAWLHSWIQMTMPEYHRSQLEWRCAAPQSLSRRLFGSLFMPDLQCPDNSSVELPVCNFSGTAKPYVHKKIPPFGDTPPSPMMPKDILGTKLDVEVQVKGRGALLVLWNATTPSPVTGYRVVLRRSNDSLEEADMTFLTEVTRYLFTGLIGDFSYQTCVTVLGTDEVPMGRDCVETSTSNGTMMAENKLVPQESVGVLPMSFTTLLWSYISGCVVASTLCAILAVVVRRRQRMKKCVHAGYNPGYSAWTGSRYSAPSTTSGTTSSCYFTTPSVGSCDDDGLVVTINGIDNNHSVVDRASVTGAVGCAGGQGDQGGYPCEGPLGGTLGRRPSTCGRVGGSAFVGGGMENSYPTTGRCSTVSSFRRHLPANYIVTNTDMHGDDFFFHF